MSQWNRHFRQTTGRWTARTTAEVLAAPGDKLTYPPYHVTYLHFYNNNPELLRATCVVAHPEGTKHSLAMWPLSLELRGHTTAQSFSCKTKFTWMTVRWMERERSAKRIPSLKQEYLPLVSLLGTRSPRTAAGEAQGVNLIKSYSRTHRGDEHKVSRLQDAVIIEFPTHVTKACFPSDLGMRLRQSLHSNGLSNVWNSSD